MATTGVRVSQRADLPWSGSWQGCPPPWSASWSGPPPCWGWVPMPALVPGRVKPARSPEPSPAPARHAGYEADPW